MNVNSCSLNVNGLKKRKEFVNNYDFFCVILTLTHLRTKLSICIYKYINKDARVAEIVDHTFLNELFDIDDESISHLNQFYVFYRK